VQIATPSPTILFVLFRLTIEDFRGRLLHDQMYNLNSTTAYLNVGLDIAVQIFISYSSTLDSFGFEFSLAKLYIDNARCAIFNPIMDHEIINFKVRDFANRLLYNQTWNLSVSGVYIDIPLPITTMVVHNKFEYGVVFHYSIAGIENSFPMGDDQYVEIRIFLGTYIWWITDTDGNLIEDRDGDDIVASKTISGPDFVSFGWVEVPEQLYIPPTTDYTSILFGYLMMFAIFGILAGVFIVAIYYVKNVKRGGRKGKKKNGSPLRIFWS